MAFGVPVHQVGFIMPGLVIKIASFYTKINRYNCIFEIFTSLMNGCFWLFCLSINSKWHAHAASTENAELQKKLPRLTLD
jgi:hypothetical protein